MFRGEEARAGAGWRGGRCAAGGQARAARGGGAARESGHCGDREHGCGWAAAGEDEGMDEMIEVDEAMLVQEIRRARKMISESKKASPKSLAEQKLKKIVSEELDGTAA